MRKERKFGRYRQMNEQIEVQIDLGEQKRNVSKKSVLRINAYPFLIRAF